MMKEETKETPAEAADLCSFNKDRQINKVNQSWPVVSNGLYESIAETVGLDQGRGRIKNVFKWVILLN